MENGVALEKNLWTDHDFEQMGWHDNKIHAVAFYSDKFQLLLDIDYICKWVKKGKNLLFWVSPATLLFKNVYNIDISTDTTDLVILEVSRNNPKKPHNSAHIDEQTEYDWCIETTAGEITFKSVGYTQFSRKNPVLVKRQNLTLIERGGISFLNYEL